MRCYLHGSVALVDPTLTAWDLRGQAFDDEVGDADVFDAIKLMYVELLLPLPDQRRVTRKIFNTML